MNYSRRSFLKTTGILASGAALGTLPLPGSSASAANEAIPFGLQLYTLRDIIPDDPKGVLKQIAKFGYKQIESYEGQKGMFGGWAIPALNNSWTAWA